MKIKEITKLNLQDGDILFIPDCEPGFLGKISQYLANIFPHKTFALIGGKKEMISGIKVISLK